MSEILDHSNTRKTTYFSFNSSDRITDIELPQNRVYNDSNNTPIVPRIYNMCTFSFSLHMMSFKLTLEMIKGAFLTNYYQKGWTSFHMVKSFIDAYKGTRGMLCLLLYSKHF